MDQTITIKGVEFPFDIMDVDTAERYEAAMQKVAETVEAVDDKLSNVQAMRVQVEAVRECLSSVLGEDAPSQIFGDRRNLRDHLEAFATLYEAANNQVKAFSEESQSIVKAIQLPANRERRRSDKK